MAATGRPRWSYDPSRRRQWSFWRGPLGSPSSLAFGAVGASGVCVHFFLILRRRDPLDDRKGRGSGVCGEAAIVANQVLGRAQSSPGPRSRGLAAAGRLGLPGGDLTGLAPVFILNGSTLYS